VHPIRAAFAAIGRGRKARLDEARRKGRRQHLSRPIELGADGVELPLARTRKAVGA
jgi:hypothetical protein